MTKNIQSVIKHVQIQKGGCLFLCHCRIGEILTGREFSDDDIIKFYRDGVMGGVLAPDCTVMDGIKLINMIIDEPKFKSRVDREADDLAQDIVFIRLTRPRDGATHFNVRHKKDVWDSLDPKRPAAKDYVPTQWRWFT